MTKLPHHSEVEAATTPSISRGTSSRQPLWLPRCSRKMIEMPAQASSTPRPEATMTQTTAQASWTAE